jgi:hypothetical protein
MDDAYRTTFVFPDVERWLHCFILKLSLTVGKKGQQQEADSSCCLHKRFDCEQDKRLFFYRLALQ